MDGDMDPQSVVDVNILNAYRGKCIYRMHVYLLHIIDIICIDSTRFQPRSLPSRFRFRFWFRFLFLFLILSLFQFKFRFLFLRLGLCFMIEHLDIPMLSGQPQSLRDYTEINVIRM